MFAGMSIGHLDIDISNCFADGQAYVALSRATSKCGLRISGKVDVEKVRAHRIGLAYDRGQPVPTWLEECKQR